MARRIQPHHQDDVRAKIQAYRIVEELQRHIDGQREMTPTQIRAAEILLNKSVSNAATEFSGPNGKPIELMLIDAMQAKRMAKEYAAE